MIINSFRFQPKTSYLNSSTIVFFTLLLLSLFPTYGSAKIFRNAYISFELPQKWKCKLDGTEWICNSSFKKQAREAIIVLTAKESGPSDNLSSYQQHLKRSRLLPRRKGRPLNSKIMHAKNRKISNQMWVDGLHKNSEVPNYYTRYLATVKNNVAILVTFSAHIKHYTKYSADFFRAIQSLRVVASKSSLSKSSSPLGSNGGGGGMLGGPGGGFGGAMGSMDEEFDDSFDEEDGSGSKTKTLGIALLVLAIGAYLILKKR